MSSVGDMFGGLLGETTAQFQAKQANNRAKQSYDTADKQNQEASGFRQQALPTLSGLAKTGTDQTNFAAGKIPDQLNAFLGTTDANNANPYSLSPAEQTELNGHLDTMSKGHEGNIAKWKSTMASRGITDPVALAAGEMNLRQGYDAMRAGHSAAFTEAARQNREKAQTEAMQYLSGLTGQGAQIANEGAGGIAGLGSQAIGAANAQQNQGAQQNQIAMQNQAQNANALSGVLQLGGFGLGGGFNNLFGGGGGGTPPIAATSAYVPGAAEGPYAGDGFNSLYAYSLPPNFGQ